jgi:hypothetical protein
VAIAILLVVAIAGIAALVLVPRDRTVEPSVLSPEREHTPAFAFAVTHTGALPTAELKARKPVRTNPVMKLHGASKLASTRVISSVTRLYRDAFLDPANWRAGTYGSLLAAFAPAARPPQARKDVRVMTAGGAAGDAYAAISPRPSTITTTVLLDRRGRPAIVLASARFRALGRTIAGTSNTRFDSAGRFFFERTGSGWKIVSFDVRRHDRPVDKRSAGSSVGPSPTEAAT